jgi:hypothetical protein
MLFPDWKSFHASVKTEVFLLPVSLSALAAKKDFQSGKSMLALIICRYFYFS